MFIRPSFRIFLILEISQETKPYYGKEIVDLGIRML